MRITDSANYQKISELTSAENEANSNAFDGDGLPFKGKLIGMEDIPTDRDEKICLESMFQLKIVVRARGEHKQKIQFNLSINGIKVFDDLTKVEIASHEIRRIAMVIMDPRDPRAFGYIYNTTDDRHQFWVIKTERPAQIAVFAMKDLFEAVFALNKNSENTQVEANQTTSTPLSFDEVTDSTQKSPWESTPVFMPQTPIQPPTSVPQTTQPPFDNTWGDSPSTTVPQSLPASQQQSKFSSDFWDFSEPAASVPQTAPPVEDSPVHIFSLPPPPSRKTTIIQPSASVAGTHDLFSIFSTAAPLSTVNNNAFIQSTQQAPFAPQQQLNFLDSMPISSTVPPTVTSPFSESDFLGDFSSGSTVAKTTNEFFFPPPPPPPVRSIR